VTHLNEAYSTTTLRPRSLLIVLNWNDAEIHRKT